VIENHEYNFEVLGIYAKLYIRVYTSDYMNQKDSSSDKKKFFSRINNRILFPFIILIILLILLSGLFMYQSGKVAAPITTDIPMIVNEITEQSELDSHAQFIRYYDEVLTQSARNYAFTQDTKWKTRYYETVPLLDKNINAAIEEGGEQDEVFFEKINTANIALIELEEQAIQLVDTGKSTEAINILDSDIYWNHKETYTQGLVDYVNWRGNEYDETLITSTETLVQVTIDVNQTIQNSRYILITVIIISIILGIVFSFYINRSVSKPIKLFHEAIKNIKQGKFNLKLNVKTGDELEDLGEAFNAMSETLGQLDEEKKKIEHAKTEFMSITSHEMRSPMTPMQGQLQMLLAGTFGKISPKQREAIDIVSRNATRLDGIIQDFLEVSRIEAARLKFNFQKRININEHVNRLVTEMKVFMPEKKINITTNLEKVSQFEVDPDRVMQVLRNLTNNAIKFTPDNGTINITTEKQGIYILFKVKDSGIGISPENQQRIFEPFFQEEQTMYRQYGGTGLGLAICRGIVEAQGGKIWLESAKGAGTTLLNITSNENLGWAGYTNNSDTLTDLGETSTTNWNSTITLGEGHHNLTLYANDSADNQASEAISIWVDLENPGISDFTCTDNVNVSLNSTCYANFTETIGLNYAIIGHNATGTWQNSSQVSLSGTTGSANLTITSSDTSVGNFTAKVYVFDLAGQENISTLDITVLDDTFPSIGNISYVPNTTDDLDPDQGINISADITEDQSIASVALMYQNTTDTDWTVVTMTNTSATKYNASFTPSNGTYTFAINATDSQGNQQLSDNTTVIVANDTSASFSTTVTAIKSYTQSQAAENNSLGDLILNNTGDTDLNITVNLSATSIGNRLSINYTNNQNQTYEVSAGTSANLSIEANTTNLPVGLYSYNVSATYNPTTIYERNLNIQSANGPYLDVGITEYSSTVDAGDSNLTLVAQVTNLGTTDATGVNLSWTLPSDWTIDTGSELREIGTLPIGASATNSIVVTVGSTETTETIYSTAVADNSDTGSDSKSITVGTPATTTVIGGDSGSSGGSSGSGGSSSGGSAYTATSVVIEVVSGTEETYPITVTNPYAEANLEEVTIEIDGFFSQYVTVSPTSLPLILPGENRTFTLTINAPSYLDQESYTLKTKVVGSVITGEVTRKLTDKRTLTLLVQEISRDDAIELLEQAKQDILDMQEANFSTNDVSKIFVDAETALLERDNAKVRDLSNQIHETRETAFETFNLINEIADGIDTAESRRLKITDSKELLNLAIAAFDREDYDTANARIKDAQLSLFLETKGKINFIWFVSTYWWAIILAIASLSVLSILIYQEFIGAIISQKLRNLNKEEQSIRKLIKAAQKQRFKTKTLGVTTFNQRLATYENRLTNIKQQRANLRHKRARVLKKQEELQDIEAESKEVQDLIKKAQKKYFEEGKISRKSYLAEVEKEQERLAEIEDERSTIETRIATKRPNPILTLFKKREIKITSAVPKKVATFEKNILAKHARKNGKEKRKVRLPALPKLRRKKKVRGIYINLDTKKKTKLEKHKENIRKKGVKHLERMGFKVKK
jgi:signal transduction histidine kinase